MITYVDLYFPTRGTPSPEVAQKFQREMGLSFIRGAHDLCFRWDRFEQFEDRVERIHRTLQGTGVIYRLSSFEEEREHPMEFVGWPPVHVPEHPTHLDR